MKFSERSSRLRLTEFVGKAIFDKEHADRLADEDADRATKSIEYQNDDEAEIFLS